MSREVTGPYKWCDGRKACARSPEVYDQTMAPTVKDLIATAVTAAQNQATAQTATRTAVAGIAAQRGSTGPATANSAGTPEAASQ